MGTIERMTIKDGKFYKGKVQVPAEHGNKEQIELLAKANEMATDGFCPEIRIQQIITMEFTCVCGALNEFNSFEPLDLDDDPEVCLRGEKDKCHYCGLTYEVFSCSVDGLMLKLIPKNPL